MTAPASDASAGRALVIADAWRLALGTLTALPVRPPRIVDRRRAGWAMVLAPVAVAPLGIGVAVLAVIGDRLGLSIVVIALFGLGAVALGTRGVHLDGLSDVADGLAASYDPQRSLAVMRTGASGPAGVVAVLFIVGLQVAGLVGLLEGGDPWRAGLLAGMAICGSRAALVLCCVHGIRPARDDGLGRTFTQTVAPLVAGLVWIAVAAVLAGVASWAGLPWWRGVVAAALAVVVVALLLVRAISRLGGVTGDVFGATVEVALAALLVALA